MNLVILDGTINSLIERMVDPRRLRARFTVATGGEEVGVEVRGQGAKRLWTEWEPGDGVHVRGRLTAGGYVAADFIKRRSNGEHDATQISFGVFGKQALPLMELAAATT